MYGVTATIDTVDGLLYLCCNPLATQFKLNEEVAYDCTRKTQCNREHIISTLPIQAGIWTGSKDRQRTTITTCHFCCICFMFQDPGPDLDRCWNQLAMGQLLQLCILYVTGSELFSLIRSEVNIS